MGLSGLMLPLWIMSGVLWPLESIPHYFRYISDLSPITLPLDALRSIMFRGWTYNRTIVLYGYLITVLYTLITSAFNWVLFEKFSDKALSLNIWNFSYKWFIFIWVIIQLYFLLWLYFCITINLKPRYI